MALVYGTMHIATGASLSVAAALAAVAKYTALYFPATFLSEEVAFRGALDSHVHHDGERGDWRSAVLVSALWGLWHLPVSHSLPLPLQVVELVGVHVVLGVPLSLAWRRSRNLAGPALAHAVNDAVRNAFMLGLESDRHVAPQAEPPVEARPRRVVAPDVLVAGPLFRVVKAVDGHLGRRAAGYRSSCVMGGPATFSRAGETTGIHIVHCRMVLDDSACSAQRCYDCRPAG